MLAPWLLHYHSSTGPISQHLLQADSADVVDCSTREIPYVRLIWYLLASAIAGWLLSAAGAVVPVVLVLARRRTAVHWPEPPTLSEHRWLQVYIGMAS